ncbi:MULTISPECIES: hypothetical protein [Pseudomonas]|jgi:hypothetical protein|uniref:hypothetical protein n=1 Tax=Pseudomonas TaxID=286 RepID=UPI000211FCDD|nr:MULTISPECIES: hypothetical protein [Pseudomonas]DBA08780.1 TPA_asm: hypothetical protein [Pseudomonas phage vB_PaeS-D14O]EIU6916705.1 hypothetical protein [Pseudomonas aeruginosa]EJH4830403.1 hypothetical protein [Pseudomonas aeruginosa]EKF3302934.1 hypothetical protein [Pseudomonas aeruginosa]EKI0101377.1 hypothetical protein [Pseudomonas aeruginosa]
MSGELVIEASIFFALFVVFAGITIYCQRRDSSFEEYQRRFRRFKEEVERESRRRL